MPSYLTLDFADIRDDAGALLNILSPDTVLDGLDEPDRPDAVKISVHLMPTLVGWVKRQDVKAASPVAAPQLKIPHFVEAAQDAAAAVNNAFGVAEVEMASSLLLVFAWLDSGWQNKGDVPPVAAGTQPDALFGPFGFRPGIWKQTIDDPANNAILQGIMERDRINPYLQCYVAACYLHGLQTSLRTTIGKAPSVTLIRLAHLIGVEACARFVKLDSGDPIDRPVLGQPALSADMIAAQGDLFADGVRKRSRGEVEKQLETLLNKAAQDANAAIGAGGLAVSPNLGQELGSLSRKYEARGPGDVSGGQGDPGGVSYGSYQMTSRNQDGSPGGTAERFVTDPGFRWADRFRGQQPGSELFTNAWKALAVEDKTGFFAAQQAFIKRTHYDPLVQKIKVDDQFDVGTRSMALQNVVWSTAVQHGGATDVVHLAVNAPGGSFSAIEKERDLIHQIYAERGRRDPATGKLARFSMSSDDVQAAVAQRFVNEERDALAMYDRGVA